MFAGRLLNALLRQGTRVHSVPRYLRALNERLDLRYLARRWQFEDEHFDAYAAACPPADLSFSIVMPVYGIKLHYLRDFVRSLTRQSLAGWQLCLCDDADPTTGVADYLVRMAAAQPERIKLIRHRVTRGIAAATRSALSLATGDVVVFADADDELHPRALEALAHGFGRGTDVDLVYSDHDFLTDWGQRYRPVNKPAWSPELLIGLNYINHLVAVRRQCLAQCEQLFTDEVSGAQDWHMCLQLSRVARRICHVPLVLYHWRARPGSVAAGMDAKPLAVQTARRVRAEHIAALDDRLQLTKATPERFEQDADFKPGRAPPLIVLRFTRDDGEPPPQVDYSGSYELIELPTQGGLDQVANRIDRLLAPLSGERLVWFLEDGQGRITGSPSRLAAYACMPAVGAVWPFRTSSIRYAYTVDGRSGVLTPLLEPRSTFSHCTGNILTGPLHGLMTDARVVNKVGGFGQLLRGRAQVRDLPFAALGALYGLRCLQQGRRNVAVRGILCQQLPPVVPWHRLPEADPYW